MKLSRIVMLLLVAGGIAIFLVNEQSRITRAGYAISKLSGEERHLVENLRLVKVDVTRLSQTDEIERKVADMRLGLMPPPEDNDPVAEPPPPPPPPQPEREKRNTAVAVRTSGRKTSMERQDLFIVLCPPATCLLEAGSELNGSEVWDITSFFHTAYFHITLFCNTL